MYEHCWQAWTQLCVSWKRKMLSIQALYLVALLITVVGAGLDMETESSNRSVPDYTFPDGFLLGVATAAYQSEGGWNEDGKGANIWDTLTHTHPDYVDNGDNGDVACDSYHKYREDVQLLKQLGVDLYRFSISWSRVLPDGHANRINQAGINYYNNLINELLANGIQPMVTMYHWDLPQALQDLGGWTNLLIADYFEDYARVLYTNFGDRVKWWITINDPRTFVPGYACERGPAPCVFQPGVGDYLAVHTVLHSHAKAYHLYNQEFRSEQQGKVGITLQGNWCEPLTNSTEDIGSCERFQEFSFGMFAHPIYSSEGDYPAVVKERIATKSNSEGYTRSRLPLFSQEDVEYIRGTFDYLGLNSYTTFLGNSEEKGHVPSFGRDSGVTTTQDTVWPASVSSWLKVVPWGFRKQLNWIKEHYNNPPVFVTENGVSDRGEINDTSRITYHTSYMTEMLKAIHLDGCNVIGYAAWSFLDNFEWNRGYSEKFGMFHVDFNNASRPRTAKESSSVFTEIISTRQIPERFREHQRTELSV